MHQSLLLVLGAAALVLLGRSRGGGGRRRGGEPLGVWVPVAATAAADLALLHAAGEAVLPLGDGLAGLAAAAAAAGLRRRRGWLGLAAGGGERAAAGTAAAASRDDFRGAGLAVDDDHGGGALAAARGHRELCDHVAGVVHGLGEVFVGGAGGRLLGGGGAVLDDGRDESVGLGAALLLGLGLDKGVVLGLFLLLLLVDGLRVLGRDALLEPAAPVGHVAGVRGADVARVGADVARVDVAGDVLGGVGGAVVVEVRDAALARSGDLVRVVLRHGGNCEEWLFRDAGEVRRKGWQ